MRHSRQDGVKVARAHENNMFHSFFLFCFVKILFSRQAPCCFCCWVLLSIRRNPQLYGDGFLSICLVELLQVCLLVWWLLLSLVVLLLLVILF